MPKGVRKTKKASRRKASSPPPAGPRWLTVRGARQNNLRGIDVHLPLGRFICVTGVSGSGKSSLVIDIVRERLSRDLNGAENVSIGAHDAIEGLEHLDKVIDIDQKPIGRTPRSNPATYVKVFDQIRDLFSRMPDAKVRGYKPGRFSFNVASTNGGGRCEACEGNGANRMDMEFLADIWVTCPVCGGKRFNRETLQVHYRGMSIADVLEMDVQQALEHFDKIPKIAAMLRTLHDVGLDYLKLGQSSTTLSGGEAQRIKLARELVKKSTGQTLYILDEPTTGLHFEDIRRLLAVLHGFVDVGNTVVVIEHNLDVIKTADWVIDLGPEGGDGGGEILVEGTPEAVAACDRSHTGKALKEMFDQAARRAKPTRQRQPAKSTSNGSGSSPVEELTEISVVGAQQHNLKDVNVSFPRGQITVCSGVSGSGKSSFAFDTIYNEGQRRYLESLSSYARQFLGQVAKPKVEQVEGLSPAISIEQKTTSRSPRSTVGTVTEVYDYMRVLWSRIGQPYCPQCDVPVGTQTSDEIIDRVMREPEGTRALLLAPIERHGQEDYAKIFTREKASGFARVRIDGEVHELSDPPTLDNRRRHKVELVVDRIIIRANQRARIADSVEMGLSIGNGVILLADAETGEAMRFSQLRSCMECGTSYEELTPHHFSFNTRLGWCETCEGLGVQQGASVHLIVPQPERSIRDGAVMGWADLNETPMLLEMMRPVADHLGVSLDTPWKALPEDARRGFLHGTGAHWFEGPGGTRFQWKGFYPAIDEATRSSWQYRHKLSGLTTEVACQRCSGSRLRSEAAAVRVDGRTIVEACRMPLDEAYSWLSTMKLDAREKKVAGELLTEITNRLKFLVDVGLDYVTLHRSAPTLSGGESQRIRLASQIGSGLTGVLYVLDEPTIGLHPRDTRRLIAALDHLRGLGNTLLMVEHDKEVITHADHVLDFGPGAGADGGRIVAQASPKRLRSLKASLTGRYLANNEAIPIPTNRRAPGERCLEVIGARHHNLRNVDVSIPLGCFVAVTGVSGSGKSSLVNDVVHKALARRIHRATTDAGGHDELRGVEHIDKVINVDQSPLGNSPSSNPATYTGVFDRIRELFAKLPEAKVRGYNVNRFSFNRPGGRCDACEGNGQRCIEMHFLPDVWISCEECGGMRYKRETLEVKYKGRSIADVLEMRINEALALFTNVPRIKRMLQTLADVGVGYLQLGQAAPTLSGGEAQRVKLAAELGRPSTGKTVYILDEPTTGLHFDDLRKLLDVLHRFCDMGNSVVCIEHNLDVIKTADWVIDLGPEGGLGGGEIVAEGPPEKIAEVEASHTGRILAEVLASDPTASREVFDPEKADVPAAEEERSELVIDEELDDARMPWEVDGRRWHTRDRVGRKGEKVRWEGAALEWLIDEIEAAGKGRLAPTDYNSRSMVEIKMPGSNTPWFFHARTAGTWLLDVSIRVPSRAFSAAEVRRLLPFKPLDDMDDLPVYGRSQRVTVRHGGRGVDDIRIQVNNLKELTSSDAKTFIKRAMQAYQRLVRKMAENVAEHQPWKVNGRQWHLGQQMISKTKSRMWKGSLIVTLLGLIKKHVPQIKEDWNRKVMVVLNHPEVNGVFGRLVTNHAHAMRVEFRCGYGQFTPAMVEKLGIDPRIRHRKGEDQVQFWIQEVSQIDEAEFGRLIRESVAHFAEAHKA